MIVPATEAAQRPPNARLLAADRQGRFRHLMRKNLVDLLDSGDLVIANDAATLPASLHGTLDRTGEAIEVRLAGWPSPATTEVSLFSAIVFGAGDFRVRTEDRPAPRDLGAGDRLTLGSLTAVVRSRLGHPRLLLLEFEGAPSDIWKGLALDGRPIQYSHLPVPLRLWNTWTPIAGPPVAFEAPSAGFVLDWQTVKAFHDRGIAFATITHAAGISSTGDPLLDRRLPFDEPYHVPVSTARRIESTRTEGRRIVAIGTTVVRALEEAARPDGSVQPGFGVATGRIGARTRLRVVTALVSGVHEPGTSHHDLLRAFLDGPALARLDCELSERSYRNHEFGDSIFVEA